MRDTIQNVEGADAEERDKVFMQGDDEKGSELEGQRALENFYADVASTEGGKPTQGAASGYIEFKPDDSMIDKEFLG